MKYLDIHPIQIIIQVLISIGGVLVISYSPSVYADNGIIIPTSHIVIRIVTSIIFWIGFDIHLAWFGRWLNKPVDSRPSVVSTKMRAQGLLRLLRAVTIFCCAVTMWFFLIFFPILGIPLDTKISLDALLSLISITIVSLTIIGFLACVTYALIKVKKEKKIKIDLVQS